jgi:ketosteroid isomerase-like protein
MLISAIPYPPVDAPGWGYHGGAKMKFRGGHYVGGVKIVGKFVTTGTWAALAAAAILTAGCGSAEQKTNSKAADEKALRDLVDRTVAAAGRNDMGAYMKFYAPKAALVLPGLPITELTAPLRNSFAPGYKIKMVTTRAEVSAAGDFGYAYGTYEQTAPDKSGALVDTVGKWMDVFRKQPDGTWGAIADTYNVDPPP